MVNRLDHYCCDYYDSCYTMFGNSYSNPNRWSVYFIS